MSYRNAAWNIGYNAKVYGGIFARTFRQWSMSVAKNNKTVLRDLRKAFGEGVRYARKR